MNGGARTPDRRAAVRHRPGAGGGRVRPRLRLLPERRYDDRGQAAVEFAGTLPVILLTIGLLWQAALTGYTFSLAGNAADEGARAGAVGGQGACDTAARRTLPSSWKGARVSCRADGELFRAEVRMRVPLFFPGGADIGVTVDGEGAALDEREER
ncbi:TadE/TadG family type IV pilus assembly protein [Streptomyces sp. NPDC058953]|uniref:TadE/TadG family type IV pilus assembly protein n=1 Tax=unclassified Streptomyces TaxID=2593676 RepID=UPI0036BE3B66